MLIAPAPTECLPPLGRGPGRRRRAWLGSKPFTALSMSLALLCGCIQAPPAPPPQPATAPPVTVEEPAVPQPPPPPPRVSDAERLLSYYDYVLTLPQDQLALEQERTLRFFGQHRSEFAFMQLVLLRSLPGASAKDRAQAQEMLSSYLKETQDRPSELRPLGLMLRNMFAEHQQLEAQIQVQAQKLKDEARRNEELQQKLDAVVETERKLLERSKPQRNE
jgi:hypothetical protein